MSYSPLLIISGLDPSGGAGIIADTCTAADYGICPNGVITNLTVQTDNNYQSANPVPVSLIESQLKILLIKKKPQYIKIGMLFSADITHCVFSWLSQYSIPFIIDPLFYSSSHGRLVETSSWKIIQKKILPIAEMITPNFWELFYLLNIPVPVINKITQNYLNSLALRLAQTYHTNFFITMGGTPWSGKDLLICVDQDPLWITAPFIDKGDEKRGTGCRLSTAYACERISGNNIRTSAINAKKFTHNYIKNKDKD